MIGMKWISLLIVFLVLGSLQGCSFLPLKNCKLLTFYKCSFENEQQIIDTGNFNYHYQEPARKPLSSSRIKSLKLPYPIVSVTKKKELPANQYYSANGNICRIIDASGSEVICAVSGRWQASPPILANSLSQ